MMTRAYRPILQPRGSPGLRHRDFFSSISSSNHVRIIEAGPRDGLQNIKQNVPTSTKVQLIRKLTEAGLQNVEATSFVSPRWVPQLADGAEVMKDVVELQSQQPHLGFPVLAPNMKGLHRASAAGAKEIVVFASVTEAFSKANQNCTVAEALDHAEAVTKEALKLGIKVRGVISCIFSDPFCGPTPPEASIPVVKRLLEMGCYEVGLGDTLGVGTPYDTQKLLEVLLREVPAKSLAGHFHDTYGQGVANVVRAYDMGIRTFDSSVAGLGGCPYAPGARGNVSTEDIVYTLEKGGINTGVDLDKLIDVGRWISEHLGIPYGSRVGAARLASQQRTTTPTAKTDASSRQASESIKKPIRSGKRTWTVDYDTGEYRVSRSGATVRITLTRPRNGNALTNAMLDGVTQLYKTLAHDPTVYRIVLEAEGKYFCTGMDLSGSTDTSSMDSGSSYYSKVLALYEAIDHCPKTTISIVDGPCFGGGVGLTFVCDVRLVSYKARWTLSEIKIGVSPAIISKYLVREWGPSTAREGMISGREIGPEELLRIGALHAIVGPDETLDDKLNTYLDQLERCAPRSAAINKELTRLGWYEPEGKAQSQLIEETFGNMMTPGSEGEHGIQMFQQKVDNFSWREFWGNRSPTESVALTVSPKT